ncbi:hypothetical protein GCM10027514_24200 [Azotobacter armeniacus]
MVLVVVRISPKTTKARIAAMPKSLIYMVALGTKLESYSLRQTKASIVLILIRVLEKVLIFI